MSRCFIFGAMPVNYYPEKPDRGDLIIAADKGFDTVKKLGLTPDITVGDFDSLGSVPDVDGVMVLPVRKDDTDVGRAVELGFERGYDSFVIYGASGGLLDHSMANIIIALDLAERGVNARFIGDEFSFTVIRDSALILPAKSSGRVSVFAIGCEKAEGVTIKGLSYEADDIILKSTSHMGVSNEFIGKSAEISVKKGFLLIMIQTI